MKHLVIFILTWSAKRVLAKHQPTIVAVTGSVGKTSTKEAIAIVLSTQFAVRTAKKNLNTEVGVPLTVLDLPQPTTALGWVRACLQALVLAWGSNQSFPTHLVLEFGADRPGDIKHLVDIAPPTVAVVTPLTFVHVANYPSFERLKEEKSEIIKRLPEHGLAVLCADDEQVTAMRSLTSATVVTYGLAVGAEVAVEDYGLQTDDQPGITFALHDRRVEGVALPVHLLGVFGTHQAIVCAAALSVAKHFAIDSAKAIHALQASYVSPPGRLKLLAGIKGATLLDDSYNAAPKSMVAALEVLKAFCPTEGARRIAVLGEMAELGSHTEEQHRQLGWKSAEAGVDLLVLCGEKSRDTARGALEAGMRDEQIVLTKNSVDAGRYLDREIKTGDVVLIKGSQSSRMEKTVFDLLADPQQASELLVRQGPEWL